MKKKFPEIVLSCCADCPYWKRDEYGNNCMNEKAPYGFIDYKIDTIKGFPVWCPLEDMK